MKDYMTIAVRAAQEAGAVIARDFGSVPQVDYKGPIDPVTGTDLEAERVITAIIRGSYPGHTIIAEESGESGADADYRWIIDPLDGTVNFTHAYPFVAVSVALARGDEMALGVVFDPLHDELFSAELKGGALLNGERLRVSTVSTLDRSLLCTGFPYSIRRVPGDNFDNFIAFSMRAQGIRRAGSAALDLCHTAAGRLDGFWERELKPWDTAAGMRIVIEAGGRVTDFSGKPFNPFLKEIVASNGLIHDEMVGALGENT